MCIQYIRTIIYQCGHSRDEPDEFEECEAAQGGAECTNIEEKPAPSQRARQEDCSDCIAAASASTEPESET
jgi:hypothetical protein